MNGKHMIVGIAAAAAIGAAGYGLYAVGMQRGMDMGQLASTPPAADAGSPAPAGLEPLPQGIAQGEDATRRHIRSGIKAGDIDPANGHRVLYYHDPMVPGNRFDQPAKSPFMDMMLVPVYAGANGDDGSQVSVSPRTQQNLGVRTAEVVEAVLAPQIHAVGSIAFNERDQAVVQARTTGFVEKLHVRATLDPVKSGQPLAELYVPAWVAAQEEFLSLRRMQGSDLAPLVDAARQRMRQAGMSETQIESVERSGATQPRTVVTAPIGGVVTELMVREGMTVMAGTTLFRINGLGTVWAHAEVPESQAALLRPGARVVATTPALPGESFSGKVQALLPEVSAATRTLKARLELANRGGRLVPGMFVQMVFSEPRAGKALVVPTEAVIQTGRRSVVLLAEADGRFRPVDVTTGIEVDGRTEIRSGLSAGQRVVVSSQFLIDSEATLRGVEARLNQPPDAAPSAPSTSAAAAAPPAEPRHSAEARVERIGRDDVALKHGPIASLQMGAMTMDFLLPKDGAPMGLKVGDRVGFEFFLGNDGPQLTRLTVLPPAPQQATGGAR
ncbi:efflux RND transporter periplasmic adaptor subunit [Piscinibacter sakaiensis]|uniref:efflux RND transporter periplasmic adaptor subunit n=1 Tax=Piscinibacter sakaiensis TaxID=1547922 RepID=UPI003AB0FC6F